MIRTSHLAVFVLITLNTIAFSSSIERLFNLSPKCTKYIAEVTVTSTVNQTCGYIPATRLPGCPAIQARNSHASYEISSILATKVVSVMPDTIGTVRSQSGQSIAEIIQPSFDDNGRHLITFPYASQLISKINLFNLSCDKSAISTSTTTVTQVVSSPYTCFMTSPIALLPFYQGNCQDKLVLNLVTCGYANIDSTMPTCNEQKRAFLNDRGSEQDMPFVSPTQPTFLGNSVKNGRHLVPVEVRGNQVNATVVSNLVVSSLYTCYDTGVSKLFPLFNTGDCTSISLCSSTSTTSETSTTTVTVPCGTIPAGNLPLCPLERSVVDPSLPQNVEMTRTLADSEHQRVPEIESSLSQSDEKVQSFSSSPRAGSCASYIVTSTTTIVATSLNTITRAFTCYTSATKFSPAYVQSFCDPAESVISGACTIFRDFTSRTFTSPNYPNKYPINVNICWVIIAPEGKKITLTFTDFQLEFVTTRNGTGIASNSTYCPYDMVKIYDGASASTSSSPIIACGILGSITPNVFTSTTNYMYITFNTDNTYEYRGFSASFTIA